PAWYNRNQAPSAPPAALRKSSCSPSPECGERSRSQRGARQPVSDDPLGKPPGLDQHLDVQARGDTHLLAEQREFFGGDVAWRPRLAGKRAAAEARHRGIERGDPEPQALIGAGDALPARVVQMKGD